MTRSNPKQIEVLLTPPAAVAEALMDQYRPWTPEFNETPVALWFSGVQHAVVAAEVVYCMFDNRDSEQWFLVNRTEVDTVLGILGNQSPTPRNG